MHAALAETLRPDALSTMLVKAALDVTLGEDDPAGGFIQRAESFFAPLREPAATVTQSALQTGALFQWLQALMAAARAAGEGDPMAKGASDMRDDLLGQMRGPGQPADGLGEGDSDGEGGETDQRIRMESSGAKSKGRGGRPLTPEQIRKLLEHGGQLKPAQANGGAEGEGMYLTNLLGKDSQELDQLREQLGEIGTIPGAGRLMIGRNRSQDSYYAYDEWDYVAADYRRNWCRLREILLDGDNGDFFAATLERYSEVLPQVRRHFQKIRPASYRMVRGLEDGDEIDVDRMIEARVARLMGETPDGRVYKARKKEARDVATLFLLDMSASTDEPIHRETADDDDDGDDWMKAWQRRPQQSRSARAGSSTSTRKRWSSWRRRSRKSATRTRSWAFRATAATTSSST